MILWMRWYTANLLGKIFAFTYFGAVVLVLGSSLFGGIARLL